MKKAILIAIIALVGCSQTKYVAPNDTVMNNNTYKTKIIRDSVYLHDSVFVKEYTQADTVYRDRWHIRYKDRWFVRKDTIAQHDTTYVRVPVEINKEVRVVPKFYKWCTGLFWVIVIGIIALIALKLALK